MRRPRYCQRFDSGTLQLADDVAGWLGESLQEFIEYAVVSRCMDVTLREEYIDRLGTRSEDQYGIVHQYWENRRRNDQIREGKLPF